MPDEIREVLGDEADAFMAVYGVTRHGNFEGKNILEFVGDMNRRPVLPRRAASCTTYARNGCIPALTTRCSPLGMV